MAKNPPYGAVFTYYMKSTLKSRKETRQAFEKDLDKKNADVFYPPWDSLKAEDREENPAVVVTISDVPDPAQPGVLLRLSREPIRAAQQLGRESIRLALQPSKLGRSTPKAATIIGR